MKKESRFSHFILLMTLFVIFLFSGFTNSPLNWKTNATEESPSSFAISEDKQLNHLVLFNFKESATPENIAKAEDGLVALQEGIPQIKDLEWGFSETPGSKSKGFSHCFILTFGSEKDLGIYLAHQEHKAYGKILHPYLEDFLVLDYWVSQ